MGRKIWSEITMDGQKLFLKHQQRGKECLDKEVFALQLLEDNFINEPKIDHYPFPKLISTEVCKDHLDFNKSGIKEEQGPCYILTMTHCGINAFQNAQLKYRDTSIQPKNAFNTVECIINNLRRLGIKLTNIKGQNTCINENGQISLIDFDYYAIMNKEKADIFYKKPDLKELKDSLYTTSFREELRLIKSQHRIREFAGRFKANPWSMLYMF